MGDRDTELRCSEGAGECGVRVAQDDDPVRREALEGAQAERVRALRARRDGAAADAALVRLRAEAASDVNLMPAIVDAAGAYVTLGEMCDALRDVWGIWRETPVF